MAKFTIAELVAKFTGDTKGLEDSVYNATYSITKFAKGAAVAAGAASAAMGYLSLKTFDVVGANDDLAKSLGISYKALVDLKLVAEESGTTIDRVGASIGIMQKNLIDATAGSGAAYDALSSLGIAVSDIIALSPDQQFGAIAQKIAEIENPTLRNAIAMDVFGKSGKDIVQMFDGYNLKMAEATKFNEEFNISLSQIDVEKLGEAEDAVKRINTAMGGLSNTVAVYAAPAIEGLARAIIDLLSLLPKLDNFMQKFSRAYYNTMKPFLLDHQNYTQVEFPTANTNDIMKRLQERVAKTGIPQSTMSASTASSTETTSIAAPFRHTSSAAEDAVESVTRLNGEILETVDITTDFRNSAADAFSGFITSVGRGENAMESLRSTALNVINDIIQNMFRLSFGGSTSGGGIGSTIASSLFNMIGGGYSPSFTLGKTAPPRKPFATGGVISGAQIFPIGANLGEMGEKGPEAIMPLVRGSGGKLGVASSGGSGKSVTVNNNFALGVQQTVRAEIARMLPDITRASVGAVGDAQNRNVLRGA